MWLRRFEPSKAHLRVATLATLIVMCALVILSAVFPFPEGTWSFLSIGTSYGTLAQEPEIGEIVSSRDQTSKVYYLGNNQYATDTYIGAIHYEDEYADWQDIDVTYEEADTGNYTIKFTKAPYLGRIGEDSRRRIYPDRNNLDCWIEFHKPFETMPTPSRQGRWLYWDFTHALMGIRFDSTSVKFGFRLKDSEAPTSITMPFTTQGLTRNGRFLYHGEECVGELRRPWAIDANNVTRDCEISFGVGSVTVSLNTTDLAYPIDIDPTLDLQLGHNLDDIQEQESNGAMSDSSANYLSSSTSSNARFWIGLRWVSGSLPLQGDTIDVAYAELFVYGNDDPNGNMHFQKAASPVRFTTTNYDLTGRARTTASTSWVQDNIGTGWQQTPSLVTPLQEVIDSYSPTALVWVGRPNQDTTKNLGIRTHNYWDEYAAKLHIEWTEGGCSPSISLNTSSWSVNGGSPVSTSSNYATGLTYFRITNNSGGAVTITIGGADMTGGGYTWDLADDGSPGDMIYGMYAGLSGGSYNIIVKESAPYNTLKAGLADSGTQDFGLKIYIPTNFDDGNSKSGTVTLTAVCD